MEAASLIPILAIFLLFYFLLIRPQSKRQKKAREMQASLAVGDTVMLTSGIFGELVRTDDPERVDVRVAAGVDLTVARAAIANVVQDRSAAEEQSPDAADEPVPDEAVPGEDVPGEDVPGRKEL